VNENERGMALAVAIGAIVVTGALVAGAMFVGTQEQRVAENSRRVEASFGVAETAVYEIIGMWPESVGSFNAMGRYPGANSTRTWTLVQTRTNTGKYSGTLYKLSSSVYLVDMTGQDNQSLTGAIVGGGARQRVGVLTRVRTLKVPLSTAITAQGTNISVGGQGAIDGTDEVPNATWTHCPLPDTTAAGVRISPSDSVPNQSNVTGSPPVETDSAIADSTFEKFGDVTYAELAARANVVLNSGGSIRTRPVEVGGVCDKVIVTNWGDGINRAGPCGSYFPIIHLRGAGETTLNGDQGQGILLVDGNLRIQGSYEFFGVVIIQGYLTTFGGGSSEAHFWGSVMVKNPTNHTISIGGRASLEYSKCALVQVLNATAPGALMRSRSFAALY
jgi:hypothetical protein